LKDELDPLELPPPPPPPPQLLSETAAKTDRRHTAKNNTDCLVMCQRISYLPPSRQKKETAQERSLIKAII